MIDNETLHIAYSNYAAAYQATATMNKTIEIGMGMILCSLALITVSIMLAHFRRL